MSFAASLLHLFALPLAALLAGFALAWLGWRGPRVGEHPVCRRCGFDLFGRPESSNHCPECGADLHAPRAILSGGRLRRWGLVVAGAVSIVLGTVRLATDLRRQVALDPNLLKPAWWLTREAVGADPARRDAALSELGRRMDARQLSDARVRSLVEAGLARQADLNTPWASVWGEWVERARAAGKVHDEQWRRYLTQAAAGMYTRLEVRPRVRRGDPFPIRVARDDPRVGRWWATPVIPEVDLTFDGRLPHRHPHMSPDLRTIVIARGDALLPSEVPYEDLPDGRRTVALVGSARVFDTPDARGRPVLEVPIRLEATFELVPAGTRTVDLVDDPSRRDAMESAIVVAGVYVRPGSGRGEEIRPDINVYDLPVGLACDVFIVVDGKEWPAGKFAAPAGGRHRSRSNSIEVPALAAARVDVVLRPNPDAAGESLDVQSIWNHEIVIRDVPVLRLSQPRWDRPR